MSQNPVDQLIECFDIDLDALPADERAKFDKARAYCEAPVPAPRQCGKYMDNTKDEPKRTISVKEDGTVALTPYGWAQLQKTAAKPKPFYRTDGA